MSNLLVIISAPSGTGKTTVLGRLISQLANARFSISHTTRPKRPEEIEGRDYYFVDDATFDHMVASDEFVEWAVVHGHRYGTSRKEIKRLLSEGHDVFFDVDFQGGRSLMRTFPDAVSIFLLPPSLIEVRRRLENRGTEDEATIAVRLRNARVELAAAQEYQYNVINDDVDRCVNDILAILRAERLRAFRKAAHVRALVAERV